MSKLYFQPKRQRNRDRDKKRRNDLRAFINKLKEKPCAICGIQYNWWQMQFDHIDPSDKRIAVSKAFSNSKKWVIDEVEKCRVVCANCHCDVTYKNKHWMNGKIVDSKNQLEMGWC